MLGGHHLPRLAGRQYLLRVSLTTRVLAGLAAGLVLGTFASRAPALAELARLIEPLGALFINAIRMTVVPLVVSSLVMGVASAPDPRTIGRVGWRAFALFIAVMFASTIFGAVLGPPLLAGLPIDPETAIALRQSAEAAGGVEERARTIPGFSQWLVNLVPSNPLRAAADDAMLPLIIFTLAFAVALLRVSEERRRIVVGFFHGVFDAMLVLVRWVLELAPLGVFALALPLATRMGLAAAGALAYYVALVAILSTTFALVVLYPAAVILGRVSLREFARAAAPAQAVAFSARSSLASLPAMIEGARARLRLPVEVTNFYLPLAASVFRTGTGIGLTVGVLFLARLYGLYL